MRLPNRTTKAIINRRVQLGYDKSKDWLEEEIDLLTSLKEEGLTYKEIGERLSLLDCNIGRGLVRTKNSVTGYITTHGLSSKRTNIEWTKELDNYLIDNYLKLSLPKMSEEIGVGIYAMRKRIKHLGLISNRVTEEQKEKIIELYKEGYSKSDIARLIDKSFSTVWKVLDREQNK